MWNNVSIVEVMCYSTEIDAFWYCKIWVWRKIQTKLDETISERSELWIFNLFFPLEFLLIYIFPWKFIIISRSTLFARLLFYLVLILTSNSDFVASKYISFRQVVNYLNKAHIISHFTCKLCCTWENTQVLLRKPYLLVFLHNFLVTL